MRLDFEGKEDNYCFLDSSELRARIDASPQAQKEIRAQLGTGSRRSTWSGGLSYDEALHALSVGDESLVARSDALLARLEDKLPQTSKWQRINHYTGVRVNIPATIAGMPKTMRKRKRLDRDDAPISIFMDLTSSAMVDADDLLKRGITILALARILTQHRPVELWGGVSLGDGAWRSDGKPWSSTVAWRIDTAPMDLQRAAFLLAHPSVARGIGYGIGPAFAGHTTWGGSWSWGDHALHVKTQTARLRNAMGAAGMLVIPPIYGSDPMVKDPEGWITRELERLTGDHAGKVGSEDWNEEGARRGA